MVQLVAQAHRQAVDWVESVVSEEKIDCDFTRLDGILFPHDSSSSTFRTLEKELQASINAGAASQARLYSHMFLKPDDYYSDECQSLE